MSGMIRRIGMAESQLQMQPPMAHGTSGVMEFKRQINGKFRSSERSIGSIARSRSTREPPPPAQA